MTYTQLAVIGVILAAVYDLVVVRTRLLARRPFWVSYAIIAPFQLLTNGVLTGFGIVRYDGDAIIGETTREGVRPAFLGAGRICFAPVEDLLFGFALIVLTLATWVWLGRRGVQREPVSSAAGRPLGRYRR